MFSFKHTNEINPRRLRLLMSVFFIAMAIPTAVLVIKAYDQLKWEAYYQHRQLAEELANRIDQQLNAYVDLEDDRLFNDYGFIVVEGDKTNNYVARSPLSNYPIDTGFPGIVGYFQIDANGEFSTPLLPNTLSLSTGYGISQTDLQARLLAQAEIEDVLSSNRLVVKKEANTSLLVEAEEDVQARNPVSQLLKSLGSSRAEAGYSDVQGLDENAGAVKKESSTLATQDAFDKLSNDTKNASKSKVSLPSKGDVAQKTVDSKLLSPYEKKISERENLKRAKERVKSGEKSQAKKTALVRTQRDADLKGIAINEDELRDIARQQSEKKNKVSLEASIVNKLDEQSLATSSGTDIQIFKSEIDPFEISLLESGHLVLYRNVWRDEKRYIQGMLVEQKAFIEAMFEDIFETSLLSDMSELALVYQGNVLSAYDNNERSYRLRESSELSGTLLYRTRMSAPFSDLESIFTIRHLPAGPGGLVILWAALILALVLMSGIYLLYRMSLRNLRLVNQQQDFVSAVSHELKTPLTSIRMYGEILKAGWADEDKKKGYYHFIFDESERLTRLINNVLALARMTRNENKVELKPISVSELIDTINSKVDTQVKQAGFTLNLSYEEQDIFKTVDLDLDIFSQIIINLIDNALKFSAKSDKKIIDVIVRINRNNDVCFVIRDYGPGIANSQLKKIFELFYRTENELTRETTGTGIGLALVKQLTQSMNGKIDVVNCKPGAKFSLCFGCSK